MRRHQMCIVDPKVPKPSSSHHHHIIHEKHRIIEATFSPPSLQSCSCAQVLPDVIIENGKKTKISKFNINQHKNYILQKCCLPAI